MRFGLFHNLHDLTRQRDYADLLDELRELAAICDETDFDVFWMPEHHFSVWGRELLPNPLMTAVDLAARTKRIRIGLAAAIVTFWHPLRAAEDIALLDQLSGGRVEIGFGRGNYGLEASNLNPEANPNDQAKSKLVFDEAVSVIKAALTQERFSFKGQVYQFPAPGFRADRAHTVNDPDYIDPRTGELIKLSIYPRARQQPLPMWEVVNSLDSIQHAARQDLGIIMWRPPVAALRERLRVYRDTLREATGKDLPPGARAAIMRDTFVADSEAGGRADRGRADDGFAQLLQLARARRLPQSRRGAGGRAGSGAEAAPHLRVRARPQRVFRAAGADRAADPAPAPRDRHLQRGVQDFMARAAARGGAGKRAPVGNRGDPGGTRRLAGGAARGRRRVTACVVRGAAQSRSGASASTSRANRADRATKSAQRLAARSGARACTAVKMPRSKAAVRNCRDRGARWVVRCRR